MAESYREASCILVIPAKAGIHNLLYNANAWIPVCTGMTGPGVIR